MVKGFSDSELSEIMDEIENLEKEFVPENESNSFEEGKETLSELSTMETETISHLVSSAFEEPEEINNVVRLSEKTTNDTTQKTSMEFKVEGNLKLELGFDIKGERVCVSVDEEKGLEIELSSGATFCVPVGVKKVLKKAA